MKKDLNAITSYHFNAQKKHNSIPVNWFKSIVFQVTMVFFIMFIYSSSALSAKYFNESSVSLFNDSLYDAVEKMDTDPLGRLFLAYSNRNKWNRIRNDEFEAEEAITQAGKVARENVKKAREYYAANKNTRYYVYLGTSFGEYDFKGEFFPAGLLDNNSYLTIVPKRSETSRLLPFISTSIVKLTFNNTNIERNKIKLKKSAAKKFLQSRKKGSKIDKRITVKYTFVISSIKHKIFGGFYPIGSNINNINLDDDFYNINKVCTKNKSKGFSSKCSQVTLDTEMVAHIVKIDILDSRKNNAIIQSYTVND